jgi:hypothetical protein
LPLLRILKQFKVPLRLRVAGIVTVEVLPNTSAVARLVSPELSLLGWMSASRSGAPRAGRRCDRAGFGTGR